jgi:hypothetical protein
MACENAGQGRFLMQAQLIRSPVEGRDAMQRRLQGVELDPDWSVSAVIGRDRAISFCNLPA